MLALLLAIVISGLSGFYIGKNYNSIKQKITRQEISENSSLTQTKTEVILSPSGTKKISFKDGKIMLFDGYRELGIGEYNSQNFVSGDKPYVIWSPDETWVSLNYYGGGLNMPNSIYELPSGNLVFTSTGQSSIFWFDKETAYIGYQPRINMYRISKFIFNKNQWDNLDETVVYEQSGFNRFGYSIPAAVSPNGKYIILEHRYEGLPVLSVLNTATHKRKSLSISEETYVIGSSPNYHWSGNTITFKGGLTKNSSWVIFINKDTGKIDENLFKNITIDLTNL